MKEEVILISMINKHVSMEQKFLKVCWLLKNVSELSIKIIVIYHSGVVN